MATTEAPQELYDEGLKRDVGLLKRFAQYSDARAVI